MLNFLTSQKCLSLGRGNEYLCIPKIRLKLVTNLVNQFKMFQLQQPFPHKCFVFLTVRGTE